MLRLEEMYSLRKMECAVKRMEWLILNLVISSPRVILPPESGSFQPKRRKEYEDDGQSSEFGMMIFETSENEKEFALHAPTAVLDSGCSSHTIKYSSLPLGAFVDRTQTTNIQTASSGAMIPSFGKSSNGLVKNALVIDDNDLTENLISIPKLDRAGCTITFKGGMGTVTDKDGRVVTQAPLTNRNLYEFNIREMFESSALTATALLGSAALPDKDPQTWHLRLGHRNLDNIRVAVKKNLISGIPREMLRTKRIGKSICDSCARAKSTRYVRRKKVRQAIIKQSKRNFVNVTDIMDDESSADEYETEDMDEELHTSTTTAVTVGRLRDIARLNLCLTLFLLFLQI